jgi:hypothetical protein
MRGGETPTLLDCPVIDVSSKGPNSVRVSLPTPEDENISSFRNVVFFSYSEFRRIDKALKPRDSECYTPSSELFIDST